MKILLFNLGSIEQRISSVEIDGFKFIFEQDTILWGPIPNKIFTYNDRKIPILSFFETTTIKAVFDKLPKDWYPDFVICDTSVLNYIPDIYKCPAKTILFTRDAWSDTIFNRNLVEMFDFVHNATIDWSLYKKQHVNFLPISNCAVSGPDPDTINVEYEKRVIDVVAIANYNNSFYQERYKTFYKLSDSNKKGLKIKFLNGIKRPDIFKYYQRSKIMIDWAHTLSNRSFEAALNGCLLFSHKDNKLISEFWIPWEEYIPYDDDNVIELISFYVNNNNEAKEIINKAAAKMKSSPANWGQLVWNNINLAFKTNVSIQKRINHCESMPSASLHYLSATPLLYNYEYNTNFPSNWKEVYFNRINNSLTDPVIQKTEIAPLIEASRTAFLLKKYELTVKYLDELQKVLPDYAWIYYFHGRIHYEHNELNLAILSIQKAIKCALDTPEYLQKFVLPVIEIGNPCDGRRITDYMWQSVKNHNNEFQVQAFLNLSYELLGDLYKRNKEKSKSIDSYIEAIKYVPISNCIYKLDSLLIEKKQYRMVLENTEKGIEDSPYDSILILYKSIALLQLNQKRQAYTILNDHKNALKSFIGVRKINITRRVIFFLSLALFFSKYLSSMIVIEFIKNLIKHMGFSYLEENF